MESGKLSPLLIAAVAAAVVRFVVIPYHDSHWLPFFKVLANERFAPYYEPDRDTTQNLMMAGAVWGYIAMSGLCSLLDVVAPPAWKTQGEKSYFSISTWIRVVCVSLSNMFICSWAVGVPVWILHRRGYLRGGTPVADMTASFDSSTCLKHFLIHMIVIDIWFYSTHWLLHQGKLYAWIHKLHHEFKAPTAVACMYAHPIEFCLGNVMGVILGPALTNCHPYFCAFWMAFSLASTSGSHSGYPALGATSHDQHHEHLYCNYGVGVFMDSLFGTHYEGSQLQQKVEARKNRSSRGKQE